MGIRIGALEYCSELFHQLAAIAVLLELLNQLPRDVVSGVSRHHVSNETLALRRRGECLSQFVLIVAEDEIDHDTFAVDLCDALVQLLVKDGIGLIRRGPGWFFPIAVACPRTWVNF